MAVKTDQPAPYAPASAVLALIERHRSKGLPSPVNADVLARAGVSGSLIPRTLYTLQTLDLIDDKGAPTKIFEGIRVTPEGELRQRLQDWLKAAYADALQYVDPATDDEVKVRDAFRNYAPVGQQPRMVTLFTGLFKAAGIGGAEKPIPHRVRLYQPIKPRSAPTVTRAERAPQQNRPDFTSKTNLPPALAGLLASLPTSNVGWSKEERDRFLSTFSAVLDYCFPLTPEKSNKGQTEVEE